MTVHWQNPTRPEAKPRGRLAAAIAVAVLLSACGDSDSSSATSATTAGTTAAPTTTATTAPPTTTATTTSTAETTTSTATTVPASTTTTTAVTTTTATTVPASTTTTTTELPGEVIEIGPRQGDVLAVIGVEHDDVLNVRSAPGTDQAIVAELAPTADDVVALGHARLLTSSIWLEVSASGIEGWASWAFLGYLGAVDDATAEVVADLGGIPTAVTLDELALTVAGPFISTEPASRVAVSVGPTVGDLGEITIDVVGVGDDSIGGFRLHVFGQPDGDSWSLKTVERTFICSRGVSGDLCV